MDFPHVVLARLYEHIEPIDRGERYEDPLQAVLEPANIGRVTGGGSLLNELGGIEYVDIEIELANLDGALDVVVDALEKAGAGQAFLDGATLPEAVYAELDFEAVVNELGTAAGEGSSRGFCQGPEETGLFFFGPDAEAMFARVDPVLRRLPIGQNARVILRHGKPELNPREVRMPRH